jgi:hypothetical protein
MAEETTSQQAITTDVQAPTSEPASLDNISDAQPPAEGQSVTFEPLFDTESVSEAELMGEEGEPKDDQQKPSETKEEPATSPPKDEKKQDESKEDSPTEDKPPKGFVPIQALHQERGQRQMLTIEVQQLKSELEALKSGKTEDQNAAPHDDDFNVLSDEEFDALLEEDPVEAIKYDRKFRAYEARQAEKAKSERAERQLIDQSVGMMEEAVPGLYDQDSDVNQRLTEFAIEKGFADMDGLALVTDPRTKIVPHNGGKPRALGQTAAHFVVMLHNLFKEASLPKDDAGREKALMDRVKAEVTQELLGKIKQPTGAEHKSIADMPGDAGSDVLNLSGPLTEAAFANLSDADQRRLLGG